MTQLVASITDANGVTGDVNGRMVALSSATWAYVDLPVVPRRSRTVQLALYPYVILQRTNAIAQVTFRNPAYGRFPQWRPEALPIVKMADGLQVRLDDIETGHEDGSRMTDKPNGSRAPSFGAAKGGQSISTGFGATLIPPTNTNESWGLESVELSDATGNRIRLAGGVGAFGPLGYVSTNIRPRPAQPTGFSTTLGGTLWPDEAAWRLKLEIKQTTAFAADKLVTFKNVPVPVMGATNILRLTNVVGGIPVVLDRFIRRADMGNGEGMFPSGIFSQLNVEFPRKLTGAAFDILEMTTDSGTQDIYSHFRSDTNYVLMFRSIPTKATKADITFVIQKTRTVEFLVKPPPQSTNSIPFWD